jgi:hypothetical protein
VIACDLDERPRLSPAVAAVSVAPSAHRMALARRWWITRRKRALRFCIERLSGRDQIAPAFTSG